MFILDFLRGQTPGGEGGGHTSSTLILNIGASQVGILSPMLYCLYTYDCISNFACNTIFKFADTNTAVVGLITENNKDVHQK